MNDTNSLINEIQTDIVNDTSSLENILLKSRILSDFIESNELQEWVINELNGYSDKNSLPDYRIINSCVVGDYFDGYLKASNINVSTILLPAKLRESVEKVYVHQGIFSIQEMSKNNFNYLNIPDGWLQLYNFHEKDTGRSLIKASCPISGSSMSQVLGATKSRLLEFILKIRKIHWDKKQEIPTSEQITQVFYFAIYNKGEINMSNANSTNEFSMGDLIMNNSNSNIANHSKIDNSFNSNTSEPAEIIREIENLIQQLDEINPNSTEQDKIDYVRIASKPELKQRIIGAFKGAADTYIDEFIIENKYLKLVKASIKGFIGE